MTKVGLLAGISLFLSLLIAFSLGSPVLQQINLAVSVWFQSVQPDWLMYFNQAVSAAELLVAPLFVYLSIYLFRHDRRHESLFILIAGLSWAVGRILKLIFSEACPAPPQVHELYYFRSLGQSLSDRFPQFFQLAISKLCFPSGHVFTYTVFGGWLYITRNRIFPHRIAKLLSPVIIILIITVAQSRISLGSHWLSDVVAGYLFGYSYLALILYLYHITIRKKLVAS